MPDEGQQWYAIGQNKGEMLGFQKYMDSLFAYVRESRQIQAEHHEVVIGQLSAIENRVLAQNGRVGKLEAVVSQIEGRSKRRPKPLAIETWEVFAFQISKKPYLFTFISGTGAFILWKVGPTGLAEFIKAFFPGITK